MSSILPQVVGTSPGMMPAAAGKKLLHPNAFTLENGFTSPPGAEFRDGLLLMGPPPDAAPKSIFQKGSPSLATGSRPTMSCCHGILDQGMLLSHGMWVR